MSKPKSIMVVVKEPGSAPVTKTVENTLAGLQGLLNGGYLEVVFVSAAFERLGVHTYCDEEGKLKSLAPNFYIGAQSGAIGINTDVLCGVAVFSRADASGEEIGLTPSEVSQVMKLASRLRDL